jgi:AcrR family transcriptional regulator
MAADRDHGKRARRVAATRARLIDVSLDLYVRQGFGPTTIEQITAAAGIGRSSFFRYFASKEAVLFAPSLAPYAWFIEELGNRPEDEPLLTSVATIGVKGSWPAIDRNDIVRSRQVLKSAPALQDSVPAQLSSTSRQLTARLLERAPTADVLAVQAIADLTVAWTSAAITAHIKDGRPLADHFTAVIRATCSLAGDLADLPAAVLD